MPIPTIELTYYKLTSNDNSETECFQYNIDDEFKSVMECYEDKIIKVKDNARRKFKDLEYEIEKQNEFLVKENDKLPFLKKIFTPIKLIALPYTQLFSEYYDVMEFLFKEGFTCVYVDGYTETFKIYRGWLFQ